MSIIGKKWLTRGSIYYIITEVKMDEKTEGLFLKREEAQSALSHLQDAFSCLGEEFSDIKEDVTWIIEALEGECYAITCELNEICDGDFEIRGGY